MPEGDTVWHTAPALREALAGRTLTRCDIRVPRFATVDLTGQVVDEVLSRGKHLFIRVGPASIHSHLKMDGSWRIRKPAGPVGSPDRIILEANEIRAVGDRPGRAGGPRPRPRRRRGRAPGTRSAGRRLGPARRRGQPDGRSRTDRWPRRCWISGCWPGSAMSTATSSAFVSGHLPTAPVSAVADPLALVTRARRCCGPTASAGIAAPPATPGRPAAVGLRPGRTALPSLRHADRTDDTGDRVAYWCPACQR